ncbi:alpha/beta hydrolase [Nocardia yunnanensis]|uniref:Alpha/beta hydrolase n=1 Tax=Nocardia yunnanensis TaxID=2382165 RepID=A0A386Z828_9NOCA|nr:alpha/beta hydrolase [Nocardia yunnanensis]AYF73353.1 alpha/beta hydrolase [Nocardia yunnanensis]
MSLETRVGTANAVLLHGQPGDRSDWDAVTARLPGTVTALALDRPGYGDNPEPAGSLEDNARWLLDRLDREGVENPVLVGHSYGGGVALAVAGLAPERVRGLVLVASIGPGCLNSWDGLLAAPVAGAALAVTAWSVLPWLARKGMGHNPFGAEVATALNMLAGVHHRHGPVWRSFLTEQRELLHTLERWTAGLAEIRTPALILADPADKVVPFATSRALSEQLPCARIELINGGGHHLPRQLPDAVAARIGDFVDSLD